MKKISRFIFILAAVSLLNSCDKDLLDTTPYDKVSSENMWSTESLADRGVTGVYQALRADPFLNIWFFDSWSFTGMEKTLSTMTKGNIQAGDEFFSKFWKLGYEGIQRANDAIYNLAEKAPLDSAKRGRLVAECKFLRAWFYYNLNQVFKGVPVYLTPITYNECTRGRETEAHVWEVVINDLTDCINEPNLPKFYQKGNQNYGRATKAAAFALRGKAYMWMKDYVNAQTDLDTVRKLGGPKLYMGNYQNLFKLENEQDPEMIFSVQNIAVSGLGSTAHNNLAFPISYPVAYNSHMPSPEFVESFEKADGSPFNWDDFLPGYSSMTPAQRVVFFLRNGLTTSDINKFKNAGADMTKYLPTGNEERLKPAYQNRDPRLAASVITPYSTYIGYFNGVPNTYTLRWPYRSGSESNPPFDLKTGSNAYFYYLWRKWVVQGNEAANGYVPIDQPLIRYADVVLLLAEAINEQGFSHRAIDLVNSVRIRSGHIALQTSDAGLPTYVSGQDNLRERIRNERRWELACEGINLYDEMRWETWKEKKFYPGNGIKEIWGSVNGAYSWKGDYLYKWAIPRTECEMNTNIIQNEGWIN